MDSFKKSDLKLVCAKCFSENCGVLSKSQIVQKFINSGVPKSTAYRFYTLFEGGDSFERKKGSGRPKIELNSNQRRKLDRMINVKVFTGYRAVGSKFNFSEHTAKRVIRESGYKIRCRKNSPKSTPEQEQRQKTRIRKLRDLSKGCLFVMEDESYFDLDGHNFFGGKRFVFKNLENVPHDVQFIEKKKFGSKLLVWLAVSERGHSEPYFHVTKGAVNQYIYRDECLKKLYPFIESHTRQCNDKILFWPDLASSHYAKSVIEDLKKNNVHYVPKLMNPPNVPQLRPIEIFWSNLKRRVYANGFVAKNTESLINKIKKELKTFRTEDFMNLMKNLRSKIIKADKKGPLALI